MGNTSAAVCRYQCQDAVLADPACGADMQSNGYDCQCLYGDCEMLTSLLGNVAHQKRSCPVPWRPMLLFVVVQSVSLCPQTIGSFVVLHRMQHYASVCSPVLNAALSAF